MDDDKRFLTHWQAYLEERYPGLVAVETYEKPVQALPAITPDLVLLMLDLEMPILDGKKLCQFAVGKGVDRRRIVIASAHDADHLHEVFAHGECLAVINKAEPAQQAAFLMILDSIMRK